MNKPLTKKQEAQKESFKVLQQLVFEGEFEQIDEWFASNQVHSQAQLHEGLYKHIIGTCYFFSFQCWSTDRKTIRDLAIKRHLSILKHFNVTQQMEILFHHVQDVDLDKRHFEVLNITSESDRKNFYDSSATTDIVTQMFHEEKFSLINEVEKMVGVSLLEIPSNRVAFHYRDSPGSRGCMYFTLREKAFKPFYNIIFNYSDQKKEFLLSKGIALPLDDELESFAKIFQASMEHHPSYKYSQHLLDNWDNKYRLQVLHKLLEKNLPTTTHQRKINKI